MLTLVETITPETAKAQVEKLNRDFSRFEQVIQVLTLAGEVVWNSSMPMTAGSERTVTEAA
jgi:gamma-glutamylcysteine synthetase